MSGGDGTGIKKVIDAGQHGGGDQLSLLSGDVSARADGERGPGRPKGSANKQTKAAAKLFLSKHADPLDIAGQFLDEWREDRTAFCIAHGFETIGEGARFIMGVAGGVLPYVHKKQPQAVELPADGDGAAMVLFAIPASAGGGGGDDDIDLEALLMAPEIEDDDATIEGETIQ